MTNTPIEEEKLVGVIDEGTNTIRFSIYSTPDFREIVTHSRETPTVSPKDGWFEQNPLELMSIIQDCCNKACEQLVQLGYKVKQILSIGITNQRETTIVWDELTGKPLHNALVWNDIRSSSTVDTILAKVPDNNKDHYRSRVGLPMVPYFSALKLRWLIDNVPEVRKAINDGRCKAGTVDSWIVWNLTNGALHITDVTNASRTYLMNIESLTWDPLMLKVFHIPRAILPKIVSCSEIYGKITNEDSVLKGIPISGILGNQQASLLGQMCIKPGQAKNTYRSGCFMLCNTGEKPVFSTHGLLTTVAYKLGPKSPTHYALEGSIAVGGHVFQWLQEKVRLMPDAADAEKYAESVSTNGGVYFVPAFTGLYAPYWRKNARGLIIGLTQFSTKNHIVRAATESICFQTRDILECMYTECEGFKMSKLHADGPLTSNDLLMQLQADIAGVPVFRSKAKDASAIGAAMCAAQAKGIDLCEIGPLSTYYKSGNYDTFLPTCTMEESTMRYERWKKAVGRSLGWIIKKEHKMTHERFRLLASIPASLFVMGSFAMLVHSIRRT